MAQRGSERKIARVRQAGVNRSAGQPRPIGFPLAIIFILIFGSLLVFLARESYRNVAEAAPAVGRSDWYMAWGVYTCDSYGEPLPDGAGKTEGIDIMPSNGLIHVHPLQSSVAGNKATFGKFADRVGLVLEDDSFILPDGKIHKNGDTCTVTSKDSSKKDAKKSEKKKATVKLFVWPPQAGNDTKPTVLKSDFANVRFNENGKAYVLALVPDGVTPPLPPNVANLSDPQGLTSGASGSSGTSGVTGASGSSGATGSATPSGGSGAVATTAAPKTSGASG